MNNIFKKDKTPTLNQEKDLINVDINFNEYDPIAIGTIVAISSLFLLSIKVFMMTGTI